MRKDKTVRNIVNLLNNKQFGDLQTSLAEIYKQAAYCPYISPHAVTELQRLIQKNIVSFMMLAFASVSFEQIGLLLDKETARDTVGWIAKNLASHPDSPWLIDLHSKCVVRRETSLKDQYRETFKRLIANLHWSNLDSLSRLAAN